MKTVIIDRSQVTPDYYNPFRYGAQNKCCYIGHILIQTENNLDINDSWCAIWEQKYSSTEHALTRACYDKDEQRAIEMAKEINIELSFKGDYTY